MYKHERSNYLYIYLYRQRNLHMHVLKIMRKEKNPKMNQRLEIKNTPTKIK